MTRIPGWLGAQKRARAGLSLALAVLILAMAGVACGGGSDSRDSFDEPARLSEGARNSIRQALESLPEPVGETDAEQIRSLLGKPDFFSLTFEPAAGRDGGGLVRYETWYYIDLQVAYEFADGSLLFVLPTEREAGLVLPARDYDPLDFDQATSLEELRVLVRDSGALMERELPGEYGVPLTFYVGAQIIAAYDDEGMLFAVETVPLGLGD